MKIPPPLQGPSRKASGFTLIEIMIVVMIIGLLAMAAIPSINVALATGRYNAIVNNLRVIDNQKHLWAAANKKGDDAMPTEVDLAPFFGNGRFPSKVIGETYSINAVGTLPTATVPSGLRMPHQVIEAGGIIALSGE